MTTTMTIVGSPAVGGFVVADALTRQPLAHAAVVDSRGALVGESDGRGRVRVSEARLPLTVKLMGFDDRSLAGLDADTVFLSDAPMRLPEIEVSAKQKKMLHITAYAREYSTLASYTDTVVLFREKMIDFMLPTDPKSKFRGWRAPRLLNSRSYYRFTDASGLDSVSDRSGYHFTWSDWVGVAPGVAVPARMAADANVVCDTVVGRYGAAEVWTRGNGSVTVNVDALADPGSRKWVPRITSYFADREVDFEKFRLTVRYVDADSQTLLPENLAGYSFTIETRDRGHGQFMFVRTDQPFFVTTYCEVYILDREYIPVKEAKRWMGKMFYEETFPIRRPDEAPGLDPSTLNLIARVNSIDHSSARLAVVPDERLVSRNLAKSKERQSLLRRLGHMLGITKIRGQRRREREWREFRREQQLRNEQYNGAIDQPVNQQ